MSKELTHPSTGIAASGFPSERDGVWHVANKGGVVSGPAEKAEIEGQ